LLTGVVVVSGLFRLANDPSLFREWLESVRVQHAPGAAGVDVGAMVLGVAIVSLAAFPQMALGLSGFELSMASAPLVRGQEADDPATPRSRIRNARKLLVAAALIMSVFILGSVLVVTLLVPEGALGEGGPALHRSLAYLAHGGALVGAEDGLSPLFGRVFGTVYDASTVLILC